MTTNVSFQLLGTVTAVHHGRSLDLRGPTAKAVLATLLLRGNAGVSTAELIASVWGGEGEATRDSVYHYIGLIRSALAPARPGVSIQARRPGYSLVVADEAVDWRRFRWLVAVAQAAEDAGDLDQAAALLDDALRLWRGPPLAGVGERLGPARRDMSERRLAATEELAAVEAARGYPQRVIDLLLETAAANPGRERCAALVVEALAASGRRDEAGVVYRRTTAHLAEHLGLDPGELLVSAHRATLRGSGPMVARAARSWPAWTHPVSGLPRKAAHFTGRESELEQLLGVLRTADRRAPAAICAIHGMAGVGKTTLAVHAASEVADAFPDGCLFIDLHGFSGDQPPVSPMHALDRLVRRLGVPEHQIPRQLDDRAALYRECLAGRRILVVLDNARNAAQVRPLLPSEPGCGVLVTSRNRLTALDEADLLTLGVLATREAAVLFRSIAGPQRLAREPQNADDIERIVDHCGRLPLAIRIAAARYRSNPQHRLTDLRHRLSDALTRLTELDDGDRSVAVSLAVSYADLPEGPRLLFSLLAVHPGMDLDAHTATALIDLPVRETERLLAYLLDRHLVDQHVAQRYRLHDLVGSFAQTQALPELPPAARAAALRRLVDYYLVVVDKADTTITPHRFRVSLDVEYRPASMPMQDGYGEALAWLTAEQANLVAVCGAAAANGLDSRCWQLAHSLRGFFFLTKQWSLWRTTHELALAAARRCGDPRAEAMMLNNLGLAAIEQDQLDDAATLYQQALRTFHKIGDAHGEHTALANHAWILFRQGRYEEFLRESRRMAAFYQRHGSHRNASITLRGIALAELELGRSSEAIQHLLVALEAFERLELRLDATMALNGLGEAYRQSSDLHRAAEYHQRALEAARVCGSALELARAQQGLGQVAEDAGDHTRARSHWSQALDGYSALGAPQAAAIRELLGEPG